MIQNEPANHIRPDRSWMILHAFVVLGLPLFLALAASCIKAPQLKQGDLGPMASDEDLERVISKALFGIDPWKAQVGQQVVYDFNARIENQEQVRPLVRLTQTIRDRKTSADERQLALTIQSHELDANTGEVERSEDVTEYNSGGSSLMSLRHLSRPFETQNLDKWASRGWLTEVMKFFALTEFRDVRPMADRPVKKVTYHNLHEQIGTMAPPESVINKPSCAGVPNCQLRYNLIAYDEAVWYSETEYELKKWHYVISRDAPFLGYIVERCLASMVQGTDRRYYVRQCQFTRDFSYSGATAP